MSKWLIWYLYSKDKIKILVEKKNEYFFPLYLVLLNLQQPKIKTDKFNSFIKIPSGFWGPKGNDLWGNFT